MGKRGPPPRGASPDRKVSDAGYRRASPTDATIAPDEAAIPHPGETHEVAELDKAPVAPAAPAGPPRVGDVLGGRYELLAQIGQGAFGAVFRAHDRVADHVVAIKLLSRDPLQSAEAMRRLRRELHAALKVTHPGVVRTHDLIEFGGGLALSMEYVEGETLADRLKRGPRLELAELLPLIKDLARGLSAAHRAGVVHRDLKPANIILRADSGRPVITDFGVSRLTQGGAELPQQGREVAGAAPEGGLTVEGQIIGTPLYMAPEQMRGEESGPAADVYALGILLFEAATGARPQSASTFAALLQQRLKGETTPLASVRPDLPEWVCVLVDRCLAPAPAARFASATELRAQLDTLTSETRDRSLAPPSPPLPARSKTVTRVALALAATGLLAAAAVPVYLWLGSRLPASDRCLSIVARGKDARPDERTGAILSRMLARRLESRERRLRVATRPDLANVAVQLHYVRDADGILVEGQVGPSGGRLRPMKPVRAASASQAVDALAAQLGALLAEGQPVQGPDEAERKQMQALGTRSAEAHALYGRALDEFFAAVTADLSACERYLEEALQKDPGWPHAYALLATVQGQGSPHAAAVLARAKKEITDLARDSVGKQLLEIIVETGAGKHDAALRRLDQLSKESPDDILAGWLLLLELDGQRKTEEAIATVQHLHELRPDLQFGADSARLLRDRGRGDEVAALQARWLAAAPEAEQALVSQIAVDLDSGRVDEAERHVRDLVFVYGEAPFRLATLIDVLILAGRNHEAASTAAKLLRGSQIDRARAQRRLGDIAVLEGRFSAALESFAQAASDGRPFGNDGEVVQSLESLRSLAEWMGETAQAQKYTRELEEVFRSLGATGTAAVVAFEGKMILRPDAPCGEVGAALAGVPSGADERIARRDVQRAAALAGCGSCAEVVRAGLSPEERSMRSLHNFGRCAMQEGALPLALSAFSRIERIRPASVDAGGSVQSSFYSVLARRDLGRVLERLGRKPEAKAAYTDFLSHWGHADRVVKEADEARAALSRL